MLPGKKNRNLRSSNCWKCIEIVNPTTTTLFLCHFKSFTIPSGPFRLFGGGGCMHTPCTPPANGPAHPQKTSHGCDKTHPELEPSREKDRKTKKHMAKVSGGRSKESWQVLASDKKVGKE